MGVIHAGCSLLIRDVRTRAHLWFVLTDPDSSTQKSVLVMLVSEKPHTERTVSLEPGDHPFVQRTSNVDFGTARYIPVSKLEDALRSGEAALKEDMSMNLLLRVQHGLLASTHTPHDVVESCRRVFEHQKRP